MTANTKELDTLRLHIAILFNGTIVKCFKHLYRTHNLFTRSHKKAYKQKQAPILTVALTANGMEYVMRD